MATCLFRSSLATRLQAFLETRRTGNGRSPIGTQRILRYLDHFLMGELKPGQSLTQEIAERFNQSMAHLNPNTRINRLSVLRQFCLYLSHFDPRTCIIYRSYLPRRTRPAPYIYTRQEVNQIMAAALKLEPPGSLRPVVISTLIGLLYATGLRIGEALNLTLGDVDLRRRVIEVREGKFKKSRYAPLSPSTASRLKAYLERRRKAGFSTAPTAHVLLNILGAKHGHLGFETAFLEIRRSIGLRSPKGIRGPRIHLATTDPRHMAQCESILAVPFKRQAARVPEYLEGEEVRKIFGVIRIDDPLGRRDDALLRLLDNTGMRAQELVDLNVNHPRFTRPYCVRIHGKGQKERTCPLWPETIHAVKKYLEQRSVRLDDAEPLFVNGENNRLPRFGVRYIVAHRAAEGAKVCPSLLTRKVTPHRWRHTTAMHLLQSNVDLSMIRSWLGHASIETTNTYVEIDLEMKRKMLRACEKLLPKPANRRSLWQRNPDFLSSLSGL